MTYQEAAKIDPLYINRINRMCAAAILKHCKFERKCDPASGGSAYLREDLSLERAAKMLERRGYGKTYRSVTDGRGALCFRLI